MFLNTVRSSSWCGVAAAWRTSKWRDGVLPFQKNIYWFGRITVISCNCGCFCNGYKMPAGAWAVLPFLQACLFHPHANNWQLIRSLQYTCVLYYHHCIFADKRILFRRAILDAIKSLRNSHQNCSFFLFLFLYSWNNSTTGIPQIQGDYILYGVA